MKAMDKGRSDITDTPFYGVWTFCDHGVSANGITLWGFKKGKRRILVGAME